MDEERFQAYRHETSEDKPQRVIWTQRGEDGVYRCSRIEEDCEPRKSRPRILLSLALVLAMALCFAHISNFRTSPTEDSSAVTLAQAPSQQVAVADTGKSGKHFSLVNAASRPPEGDKVPLSIQEISKIGKPFVVAISTEKAVPMGFMVSTMPVAGSGFLITDDGYIATNNHVVEDARDIKVHTDDGKLYSAEIVGTDPLTDLAVIKIEAKDGEKFPYAVFGDSDALEVGELAVAIGNPSGMLEGSVTAGIISALQRTLQVDGLEMNVLQTDAAINAGNSGGALLNSFGEVIGINTAKLSGDGSTIFDGIAFAIPSNYARPILQDLKDHGKVMDRVQLGIIGQGMDSNFARYYKLADRPGILVNSVMKHSSADEAGIQPGDFITEINGHSVDTISSVNNMKRDMKVGDVIHVVYFRDGERQEVDMTLKGEVDEEESSKEDKKPSGEKEEPEDGEEVTPEEDENAHDVSY